MPGSTAVLYTHAYTDNGVPSKCKAVYGNMILLVPVAPASKDGSL